MPRPAPQPRLVQLSGPALVEAGRILLLDRDQVVIGRGTEGVQLTVADPGASRRHASVERIGQSFRVVDLDSRNGTFVNDVRVKAADLREGDRIQLGSATRFRFTTADLGEEWLRASLDHGVVALWDYAPSSGEVTWSGQTDGALHVPPGTLSGRRALLPLFLHPQDEVRVRRALQHTLEAGTPFEQEFRLVIGPEAFRWVLGRAHLLRNGAGLPERLTGTAVDIDEKKKRELELRRMAVMFERLSDGVFLTDGNGAIVDLNSRAERLFEVTKAGALGARPLELLGAADAAELEVEARQAFKKDGRWSRDLRVLAGGAERTFEVVAFPLEVEESALGAAFLFRDITERQRLQSRVAFQGRLAALGTLSAGVAHEINNPLSFVMGSLEFVIAQAASRASLHEAELQALQDALEGAQRIASIVRDMKAFSRDDASAQPTATDGRSALELAIKMTQQLTSSHATLTTELEPALPLVMATASRLSQVFVNLLVNAAQAMADGERGHIAVRQRLEGGFVVTEVADDGPGIPAEQLERIFDPFFTTKPVGVGTGLGLSISHALVTGFGGALEVRSQVGRGTTFFVRLPTARQLLEPSSSAPDSSVGPRRRGRLLVIDDEPLILRMMARALGADHHDVTTVAGADEALALLAHEDFDVIFCDLMMPRRTGIDLYQALLREHPQLSSRVVFISGGAFTDQARDFLAGVVNPMLTKPLDLDQVSDLVQARLQQHAEAR